MSWNEHIDLMLSGGRATSVGAGGGGKRPDSDAVIAWIAFIAGLVLIPIALWLIERGGRP